MLFTSTGSRLSPPCSSLETGWSREANFTLLLWLSLPPPPFWRRKQPPEEEPPHARPSASVQHPAAYL